MGDVEEKREEKKSVTAAKFPTIAAADVTWKKWAQIVQIWKSELTEGHWKMLAKGIINRNLLSKTARCYFPILSFYPEHFNFKLNSSPM